MVRITLARVMPLVAALAVGVAPPGAGATPAHVVVTAVDGRELSVGSLVTQGSFDGTSCVFPPDAGRVTVLAPEHADVAVVLSATDSCALVMSDLTVGGGRGPADVSVGEPGVATGDPLVDRPKVRRDDSSASPSSAGLLPGGTSISGVLPTPDDVGALGTIESRTVRVRNTVYSSYVDQHVNTVEYQDHWTMEYLRDTRRKTVYGSDLIHGGCRAGAKATFVVKPDNQSCWYENQSRPGVVKFWSGGNYVKMYGPLGWDIRTLNETYEVTYDGVTRRDCYHGTHALPPGWSADCRWEARRPM